MINVERKPSKIKRVILTVLFLPAFILVLKYLARMSQERQEAKRYKKIIKKGLFWDTEYLIERD